MSGQAGRAANFPTIRTIGIADVAGSLRRGWSDFLRAPLTGLFFGGFYAAGGMFILAALAHYRQGWMIVPVAIGFPLIGPFVAAGLYETSRRLDAGEPVAWKSILAVMFRQRDRELGWMAFVVLFVFWIWMYQVRLLTALFLGFRPISSVEAYLRIVTTTADGAAYLAVGTVVGAVLAMVLFSITVVAIPLLMERDHDFVTAMVTSVRAVVANPLAMLAFAAIVAAGALIAMAPLFLGLLVVMPVLGHSTWHLYKRVVE